MKVNLKKLLKLKTKGHTKALVYNEYANCINILNLVNMEQPSKRLDLSDSLSKWHKGVSTWEMHFEYNELIDSW